MSLPYANTLINFMRSVGAELFSRTKEKDDEEDGEYEMVWDAEGNMHLVKKAVAKAPSDTSHSRSIGRYVLLGWCFYLPHITQSDHIFLLTL
jgi:ethanolamine phosphate phosphodiesterase